MKSIKNIISLIFYCLIILVLLLFSTSVETLYSLKPAIFLAILLALKETISGIILDFYNQKRNKKKLIIIKSDFYNKAESNNGTIDYDSIISDLNKLKLGFEEFNINSNHINEINDFKSKLIDYQTKGISKYSSIKK